MALFGRSSGSKKRRIPKKPKLSKYPKKPKASASLATLQNWKKRCSSVDASNAKKVSDYNKKIDKIKEARRLRDSISGIGRAPKTHIFKTL